VRIPESVTIRPQHRWLVLVGGLLLLVSWIFPPWREITQQEGMAAKPSPLRFAIIFDPPTAKYAGSYSHTGVELDVGRLALIDLAILGACGLGLFLRLTRQQSIATGCWSPSLSKRLAIVLASMLPGLYCVYSCAHPAAHHRFSGEVAGVLLFLVVFPGMFVLYGIGAGGRRWLKILALASGGFLIVVAFLVSLGWR